MAHTVFSHHNASKALARLSRWAAPEGRPDLARDRLVALGLVSLGAGEPRPTPSGWKLAYALG